MAHPLTLPCGRPRTPADNCGFSIAMRGADGAEIAVSSGKVAANATSTTGPDIRSTDKYVWGSVTKMVTGVSIIRLANAGAFGLHDKIAPILDPYFAKQGWMFKVRRNFDIVLFWPVSSAFPAVLVRTRRSRIGSGG